MPKPQSDSARERYDKIPLKMHPRVFAALGADLVTNDVVAVIELVKNSYDAFASDVWLRFETVNEENDRLVIEDDGQGMTRDIIENVWCLIATPFKETHKTVSSGEKTRRVSGEKGLGRLSVARLGNHLHMITQAPGSDCWEVEVDWTSVSAGKDLSSSYVTCKQCDSPFKISGTKLTISGLKGQWDENRISDLEQNLARLISPFSDLGDFNISLCKPGDSDTDEVRIALPAFLKQPKYLIKGDVDEDGKIQCNYKYSPIRNGGGRQRNFDMIWAQVYDNIRNRERFPFDPERTHCGPFSFEIRVWDLGADDTQEMADKYDIGKSRIRKDIGAHKGNINLQRRHSCPA